MRDRKKQAIAGLLAIGALAAGCGGDELSEDEYREEIEAVVPPLLQDLQAVSGEASQQTTPEGVAEGLGETETVLDTGVTDLEEIEPPEELSEPHDRLVAAVAAFEQATADAREGAESGDIQAIAPEYVTAATEFQTELAEVGQEFEDAGVEFEPQTTE